MAKRKPGRANDRVGRSKAKTRVAEKVKNNGIGVQLSSDSKVLPVRAGEMKGKKTQPWLPSKSELGGLYQRYTNGAGFDEHDKAFYFVLDVGGVSRARQLIAHVEEVLAELEEFRD